MAFASVASIFGIILSVFLILLPVALLIVLQVWLCKKSSRLGLILPALSLVISLVFVLSIVSFGRVGGGSYMSGGTLTLEEDGEVIGEKVYEDGMITVYDGEGNVIDQYPDPNAPEQNNDTIMLWGVTAVIFLVMNIPTLIFGGIWLHYKNRKNLRDDLKRMRIEDLE